MHHLLDQVRSQISSRLHVIVNTLYAKLDATCTVLLQSKRSRGQPAGNLSCAGGSASSSLGLTAPAMPRPTAQGSKRARQLPAHLADYVC